MARIAGVNIHPNKQVFIGLTAIYGVGRSRSLKLCEEHSIDPATKISDLSESEISRIRAALESGARQGGQGQNHAHAALPKGPVAIR